LAGLEQPAFGRFWQVWCLEQLLPRFWQILAGLEQLLPRFWQDVFADVQLVFNRIAGL
jgi:hypothetical protein